MCFLQPLSFDQPRQSESVRLPFCSTTDWTRLCAENRASSIMHARTEPKLTDASVSTGRRSIDAAQNAVTKLPDHRDRVEALAGVSSSMSDIPNMIAPTRDMTWEFSARLFGQRVGRRVRREIKLYGPPEKQGMRSTAHSALRALGLFVVPPRTKWNEVIRYKVEKRSETEAYTEGVGERGAKMSSRNEAAGVRRDHCARPCVKNEDIQMEIWFYINHQPSRVRRCTILPDRFLLSFSFPLACSSPFLSLSFLLRIRARILWSFLFVFIRAIRLTILSILLGSRSSRSSEARDQRAHTHTHTGGKRGFICFISTIPINIYRLFAWQTISAR